MQEDHSRSKRFIPLTGPGLQSSSHPMFPEAREEYHIADLGRWRQWYPPFARTTEQANLAAAPTMGDTYRRRWTSLLFSVSSLLPFFIRTRNRRATRAHPTQQISAAPALFLRNTAHGLRFQAATRSACLSLSFLRTRTASAQPTRPLVWCL